MTRVALDPEQYEKLRWQMYVDQLGRCSKCGKALSFAEFQLHHARGRGIGGSVRNDLDPDNFGVCAKCHPEADKNRKSKFT